jgi:hypothetical protein
VITVARSRIRLSTRQLWVLWAVARQQVVRNPMYGGLCTLDGSSVSWTVTVLALRGLIAFEPVPLSQPHLTRRGHGVLGALATDAPPVAR